MNIAKPKNGFCTAAASELRYISFAEVSNIAISSLFFMTSLKINNGPMLGAMAVPNELNACERFKRLEALSYDPNTATKGLAATCKTVMPAAKMKYAKIKIPKTRYEAAG
ncbi:hypothetical protein CLV33_101457 [Jejuia pallidilutea]|uniref:Uncharacterized protein n=1 Tax=Jejuia pallidilutea TaxID=504487 RepID=A0A362X7V8_9FLAO|nr:hypothetical protein [Jejuia pallidilutea]PQV51533.1 hypothetical protein CLV33_101457 [Jejuia pallidilutea]